MDISIFGYKINLQLLIFIGIIYLILVSHTVCGCCSLNGMGLVEGLTTMATTDASGNSTITGKKAAAVKKTGLLKTQVNAGGSTPLPALNEAVKVKAVASKEGFTGANVNYGQSSPYDITRNDPVNTQSWFQPNLTVVPGQPLNPAVKEFLSRDNGPLPLENEMLLFANTEFKPECCGGSTYSNSSGCACLSSSTFNYLVTRGGNNVPFSAF